MSTTRSRVGGARGRCGRRRDEPARDGGDEPARAAAAAALARVGVGRELGGRARAIAHLRARRPAAAALQGTHSVVAATLPSTTLAADARVRSHSLTYAGAASETCTTRVRRAARPARPRRRDRLERRASSPGARDRDDRVAARARARAHVCSSARLRARAARGRARARTASARAGSVGRAHPPRAGTRPPTTQPLASAHTMRAAALAAEPGARPTPSPPRRRRPRGRPSRARAPARTRRGRPRARPRRRDEPRRAAPSGEWHTVESAATGPRTARGATARAQRPAASPSRLVRGSRRRHALRRAGAIVPASH